MKGSTYQFIGIVTTVIGIFIIVVSMNLSKPIKSITENLNFKTYLVKRLKERYRESGWSSKDNKYFIQFQMEWPFDESKNKDFKTPKDLIPGDILETADGFLLYNHYNLKIKIE